MGDLPFDPLDVVYLFLHLLAKPPYLTHTCFTYNLCLYQQRFRYGIRFYTFRDEKLSIPCSLRIMTRRLNVTYQCVLCRLPIFEAPPLRLSVSVAGGGRQNVRGAKGSFQAKLCHAQVLVRDKLSKMERATISCINHVLSPFHTHGVSQHGNIVDLHMGDVTGRVGESNKPMQCLFCNKKVY